MNYSLPVIKLDGMPKGLGLYSDGMGNVNLNQKVVLGEYDLSNVSKLFFNNKPFHNNVGKGCLLIPSPQNVYYVRDELCDTNMVKMLMKEEIPGAELYYSNKYSRVYKFSNEKFCMKDEENITFCNRNVELNASSENKFDIRYNPYPILYMKNSVIIFSYFDENITSIKPTLYCNDFTIEGYETNMNDGYQTYFRLLIPENITSESKYQCSLNLMTNKKDLMIYPINLTTIDMPSEIGDSTFSIDKVTIVPLQRNIIEFYYLSEKDGAAKATLNCGGVSVVTGKKEDVVSGENSLFSLRINPGFLKNNTKCNLSIHDGYNIWDSKIIDILLI
jgi:hypothetical protein